MIVLLIPVSNSSKNSSDSVLKSGGVVGLLFCNSLRERVVGGGGIGRLGGRDSTEPVPGTYLEGEGEGGREGAGEGHGDVDMEEERRDLTGVVSITREGASTRGSRFVRLVLLFLDKLSPLLRAATLSFVGGACAVLFSIENQRGNKFLLLILDIWRRSPRFALVKLVLSLLTIRSGSCFFARVGNSKSGSFAIMSLSFYIA